MNIYRLATAGERTRDKSVVYRTYRNSTLIFIGLYDECIELVKGLILPDDRYQEQCHDDLYCDIDGKKLMENDAKIRKILKEWEEAGV